MELQKSFKKALDKALGDVRAATRVAHRDNVNLREIIKYVYEFKDKLGEHVTKDKLKEQIKAELFTILNTAMAWEHKNNPYFDDVVDLLDKPRTQIKLKLQGTYLDINEPPMFLGAFIDYTGMEQTEKMNNVIYNMFAVLGQFFG